MSKVVAQTNLTNNKENENNSSQMNKIQSTVLIGKRKGLNDKFMTEKNVFVPNKKPSLHISEFKMIPIVSDDENSNATAPSPIKSIDSDVCYDVKLKTHTQSTSHSEPRGPALTTLHLPTAMWCSGINLVPESDLWVGLLDGSLSVDQRFARDPEFVSFQADSMYALFFEAEKKLHANSCYMDLQINFTEKDRGKMVNCMMNFARSLDLFMNTLFLAVHVMDSYMAQRGSSGFVDNAELITIVYSSLMIAAKFEEGGRYGRGWFLKMFLRKFISDSSKRDEIKRLVVQCELRMVLATSHLVNLPTIATFLNRFLLVAEAGSLVVATARCVAERVLLEYSMLHYPPSVIAACAVSMALAANQLPAWTAALQVATSYAQSDLAQCLEEAQDVLAEETVQRATSYARDLFKHYKSVHLTFGRLTQIVQARRAADSGINERHQGYERYLVPILERACLSSADQQCITPPSSSSSSLSAPLFTCHSLSPSRRVDLSVCVPHMSDRPRPSLDSIQYRHHHVVYNKLITCAWYDVNAK